MLAPLGLFDLDRLIEFVEHVLGGPVRFDQLNIPFAATATDVITGEMVVMNEGQLGPAIRASCSIPGIFTPYRRNGRLLVDGGAVSNLPTMVAQQLGAEYVIAVDLLPVVNEQSAAPGNLLEISMTASIPWCGPPKPATRWPIA